MNKTRVLIDIVYGRKHIYMVDDSIFNHAARNKILLHILRKLDINNELRLDQERRLNIIHNTLKNIWKKLIDFERVSMIKFFKPIVYVPSDLDILVHEKDLGKIINILRDMDFHIQVVEPYCVTLINNNGIIVDLYIYPSFSNIIYLNRDILLENTTYVKIDDVLIRTLSREAEVLITIAHAIYKENMITLNDYFTITKWFNNHVVDLARTSKILPAVSIVLEYLNMITKGLVEAPVRINLPKLMLIYVDKLLKDNLTRSSLIKATERLRDKRFGSLILSKMTRKTY